MLLILGEDTIINLLQIYAFAFATTIQSKPQAAAIGVISAWI